MPAKKAPAEKAPAKEAPAKKRFLSLCLYPCGAFVTILSALLGWCAQHPYSPEGMAFASLYPFVGGFLPRTIIGDEYWITRSPVPSVPAGLKPAARPSEEATLSLLGTGDRMPAIGLGMCCRPTAYDFPSSSRSVLWFFLKGGRHIDTADLYLNHDGVGQGIADAIARGVPRNEMFITTKLFPRNFGDGTYSTEFTVRRWLEELGLDYLDLVLLHGPRGLPLSRACAGTPAECRKQAWTALSRMRDLGNIRNLGVSNFNERQIDQLLELKLAPITVNQIQYNPWAPDHQQRLVNYCQEKGIVVTAWSPFQGTMLQHSSALTVGTLTAMAKDKGTTVAQIILRWALQKQVSAIPGTSNPAHMEENLAVYDVKLSDDEMATIDKLRSDPEARGFVAQGFLQDES